MTVHARSSFLISLLFTGLCFVACSDQRPSLTGNNFLATNGVFALSTDTLTAVVTQSNYRFDTLFTSGAGAIVGQVKLPLLEGSTMPNKVNIESYFRFTSSSFVFADTTPTRVDSVFLRLTQLVDTARSSSNTASGTLNLGIYPITSGWRDSVRSIFPLPTGAQLASRTITVGDAAVTEILLEKSFGDSLVAATKRIAGNAANSKRSFEDTASANGIAIKVLSASSDSVQAKFNPSFPGVQLRLAALVGTEVRDVRFDVRRYAYAVVPTYTQLAPMMNDVNYLYVQSGVGHRARVRFDLSSLPRNAQIVNAELLLIRDTSFSTIGDGKDSLVIGYPNTDDSLKYISTAGSSALNFRISSVSGKSVYGAVVTPFVQEWVLRPQNNRGFILAARRELTTIELWRFYGQSAVPGKRPELRITYLISP